MSLDLNELNERTSALVEKKGLTYREARAELGRRGAAARANKRRRVQAEQKRMERMGLA